MNFSKYFDCKKYHHKLYHVKYYDGRRKKRLLIFRSFFLDHGRHGIYDHDLRKDLEMLLKRFGLSI